MTDNKPCPVCDGTMVVISYGYPSEEGLQRARDGEIVLGGCIIREGQPSHQCNKCGLNARLIEHKLPARLLNRKKRHDHTEN